MDNQSVIIYSNCFEAEQAVHNLLGDLSVQIHAAQSANDVISSFKLNEAVILFLCFDDISNGITMYDQLRSGNTVVDNTVHRAISVCAEKESTTAAEYSLAGRIDNYFVFHPISDPGRLRLIVEKAFAELKNEREYRDCASYLATLKEQSTVLDNVVDKYLREGQKNIEYSNDSYSKLIRVFCNELEEAITKNGDPADHDERDVPNSLSQRLLTLSSELLLVPAEKLQKNLNRTGRGWADEAIKIYSRLSRKIHVLPSLATSLVPRKVLIVDDDELFRDIMVAMLDAEGYLVLTADGGKQAIEIIRSTVPDVIVLDIDMPDMTGIELLKVIRANEDLDEVPVLMLTDLVDEESLFTSIRAGANGFYAKPGNEIEGFETIDSLFRNDGPLQSRHKPPPTNALLTEQQRRAIRPLVIDDDAFMLEIIGSLLDNLGIAEWASAKSGACALQMLDSSERRYNILILDLNMPEMDGIEFLRYLAKRRYDGAILLISGYGSRLLRSVENLGSAYKLNLIGSLGKPITPFKLGEFLNRVNIDPALLQPIEESDWSPSVDEINAAIEADEFILYYQPKIEIESKILAGVEALVRWRHPQRGIIYPAQFIDLAEDYNIIGDLTYKLLQMAIEQHVAWKASGQEIDISVNIAVSMLEDLDFPDRLSSVCARGGMGAEKLTLEITETGLIKSHTSALEILNRLHLRGFKLSIDDFGTGNSSFLKLKQMPFVQVKIGKEFVHNGADDKHARAIIDASVTLSHNLDLEVVAEGVENHEDWEFSEKAGCRVIQGYFVSRPMPADEIIPWLEAL